MHAAPFAFELSRRHQSIEVVIAATNRAQLEAIGRIAKLYPGERARRVRLQLPLVERLAAALLLPLMFFAKSCVLKRNLDFFRGFDAIVAPERTMLKLRTHYGLDRVKLINTRHGQGDREGSFDARTREIDLTLVGGKKYVDQLAERGFVRDGHVAVVGYAKFEVCAGRQAPPRLFANERPTVVYNPHFDARESSWQKQGVAVLDWFAAHPEYNLIFAPHVVLFERTLRHRARIPRRIRSAPNIYVDTGSDASIDMTYTRASDIYLGDVSSQVYEFIAKPRPCVFLDVHAERARNPEKYLHWHFGPVIERAAELGEALAAAQRDLALYERAQRDAFAYTFSTDPSRTPGQRGADAIVEFLEKGRISSDCYRGSGAP
jgi:hypothetical protein